jgi:hypothetical protein
VKTNEYDQYRAVGWGLYSPYELEDKKALNFLVASKQCKERFLSGEEKFIYGFVKNFNNCFRELWTMPDGETITCYNNNNIFKNGNGRSWVIEQIEKWKAEGTPEAKKKLEKLFTAYIDGRGKNKNRDFKEDVKIYKRIKKERDKGSSVKKAIDNGVYIQHNERDIYYKQKKLEEEKTITIKNMRLAYYLPTKGIKIPQEYQKQFKKEQSLYWEIELLRNNKVSFPHIRKEAYIYPDHREGKKTIPLKKAIEAISKKRKIEIKELKNLYTKYKELEATYYDSSRLEILKEL